MCRRRGSFIALLALLALAVAACGGSTSAPPDSSTTAPLASSSTTATPAASSTSVPATTAAAAPTPSPTPTPPAGLGPDLKIDQMVDWMRFESLKCGGPIGTWPIVVSGTKDVGGGVTLVLTGAGQATLGGSPTAAQGTFAADWTISVEGVPLTTGGQDAHLDGTAAFDGTTLTIEGRPAGTSHGENPYRAVVLAMLSSVERMSFTPTAGSYC